MTGRTIVPLLAVALLTATASAETDTKHAERMFDDLFVAIVPNQNACPKMGPAINRVIDRHEAWMRKINKSGRDVPMPVTASFTVKRMAMGTALAKCQRDEGVMAAFERFLTFSPSRPAK